MKILFLSIGRLNHLSDQGVHTDLLRKFRDEGHKVYIVHPRERRLNKPTSFMEEEGVHFLRVKIGNITKVNILQKGISTLRIEALFLKAIKKHLNKIKFDLIIYSTPPITFGKVIEYIKKRDNAKSYLLLKDIFPQNAVDLNMFNKKSPIYKYFRKKEKALYRQSDYIGCMSQANVDFVLDNNPNINPEIVEVCPNSLEPLTIEVTNDVKKNIRKKYNIPQEKTIYIYGGNLGKPQGIDFLLNCLKSNERNEEAFFIIAGSGTEFDKIQDFFKVNNPSNAKLLKQIPREDFDLLANSCDVGLIFLDSRFTIPNFPSRLLTYMQSSMPVLAATDVNTDIGQVIGTGKFGFWCESSDVKTFNEKVAILSNSELRTKLGRNARVFLEENYTVDYSYNVIMKHFK